MLSHIWRRNAALTRIRGSVPHGSKFRWQALPTLTRQHTTPSANPASHATKVERIILDNIKATGPITFANYMQYCLAHPTEGYYMNESNPVFGVRGDFITSPEISQVFGELLGIWFLSRWMESINPAIPLQPRPIRLVELGPGRGTLMEDILRVLSQFTATRGAVKEVHLVETSQSMRQAQEARLSSATSRLGCKLIWHDMIEDIPEDNTVYTMLLAHEFFDALPFHLLEKTEQGWQEVLVASAVPPKTSAPSPPLNPDNLASSALNDAPNIAATSGPIPTPLSSVLNLHPKPPSVDSPLDQLSGASASTPDNLTGVADQSTDNRFRYVLSPTPTAISTLLGLTSPRYAALPVGARAEVSIVANKTARRVAQLLSPAGKDGVRTDAGAALIVDYGDAKAFGDSFRAFKDHTIVDVFHRPGECDLTANVDFAYLSEALSEHATPLGPLTQADFLERMGLHLRVERLVRAAPNEARGKEIERAGNRLVDKVGMGKEYKVLGVVGRGAGKGQAEGDTSGDAIWPFVEEA